MLVAIPTAIPDDPFNNNCGILAGNTVGSCTDPSKLSAKSTVSDSISSSKLSVVKDCNLDSVYLIAAGGSLSTDPKFPCPSIKGICMEKS